MKCCEYDPSEPFLERMLLNRVRKSLIILLWVLDFFIIGFKGSEDLFNYHFKIKML